MWEILFKVALAGFICFSAAAVMINYRANLERPGDRDSHMRIPLRPDEGLIPHAYRIIRRASLCECCNTLVKD
jgi:hypothetical protein